MASSVATMGLVGTVVPVRNAAGLSSSSSFGFPLVNAAPLRPVARCNVVVTRAALQEEQSGRTARREMLASLVAAGAALATAGQTFAAVGPGTSGAKRTNEKADELLKSADKLTTDESPPRYGPGRVGGDGDDTSRIAQKGGSGAVEEVQGAGGGAVEGAKSAVTEAKRRIDGIFGKKTGDVSDASGVFDGVAGKVSSDVDTTKSKVSSDVAGTKKKSDSFVADAESKFESSTKDGKGLFGKINEKIQEQIAQ